MRVKEMPEEQALVLQQVDEAGEEDFTALAESLCLDRAKVSHIVGSLKNKGLVKVNHTTHDSWVSISTRGKRLIEMLWPESRMRYSY